MSLQRNDAMPGKIRFIGGKKNPKIRKKVLRYFSYKVCMTSILVSLVLAMSLQHLLILWFVLSRVLGTE